MSRHNADNQCRYNEYVLFRAQLHEACQTHGRAWALNTYVREALHQWASFLDHETSDSPTTMVAQLAAGMTYALAVRDALIVCTIVRPSLWTMDDLEQFMIDPHRPSAVARMERLLAQSFDDEQWSDLRRCDRGLALVQAMIDTVPKYGRSQPYALLAYLLWWKGDEHAYEYALQARNIDEHCSLAAILLRAMALGIGPSWLPHPVHIHGANKGSGSL